MTTSHWARPEGTSHSTIQTEVLIIGGGYVGLSTAYWLSEMNPGMKITILERSFSGAGASGRNAGFLTKGSASFYNALFREWGKERAKSIFEFAQVSLELVHDHILSRSPELKFERSKSVTLFRSEEQLTKWQTPDFRPLDFGFQWTPRSNLSDPLQGTFAGAFEHGPEFPINPTHLLSTLRALLESRKIRLIENVSAFELTPEGVRTEVNMIKAKHVVLALNGYLPQFHQTFKNLITPRRAQMVAVKLEESFPCPGLHYDPEERVYWRMSEENVLLVGGKRLLDERGEIGDFEKVSPIVQNGLEDYIRERLKVKYSVLNRWSGTMGFTEHELPYVSKASAPLDTVVVGGFSGHGMGLGFHCAKEAAELVLGQKKESFFSAFKEVKFSL